MPWCLGRAGHSVGRNLQALDAPARRPASLVAPRLPRAGPAPEVGAGTHPARSARRLAPLKTSHALFELPNALLERDGLRPHRTAIDIVEQPTT